MESLIDTFNSYSTFSRVQDIRNINLVFKYPNKILKLNKELDLNAPHASIKYYHNIKYQTTICPSVFDYGQSSVHHSYASNDKNILIN